MKPWKKFALITSVCLALGGGTFTYHKHIKPWRKEAQIQRGLQEYSKIVEEYKNSSSRLDSLLFPLGEFKFNHTTYEDKEVFSVGRFDFELELTYVKNYCDELQISRKLWITKRGHDDIIDYTFKSRFFKGKVKDVSYSKIKGNYDTVISHDNIEFSKMSFRRKNFYHVWSDTKSVSTAGKLTDERLIEQVEELFNLASENYEKVKSLIEKQ